MSTNNNANNVLFDNVETQFATAISGGTVPRWQRKKAMTADDRNSHPNAATTTTNSSCTGIMSHALGSRSSVLTGSCSSRAGSNFGTPTKKLASSTNKSSDRFIPVRQAMDMELSHHQFIASEAKTNSSTNSSSSSALPPTPSSSSSAQVPANARLAAYRQGMAANLKIQGQGPADSDSKILAFKTKAPKPREGFQSDLRVMYTQNHVVRKARKPARMIPQAPERVLDAPELHSDFYLNLLDWSATNTVAIALDDTVYLWDAGSGSITELCQLEGQGTYVSSLRWAGDGLHLAIGTSAATVQIYDVTKQRRLREMQGHQGRVAASDWNQHLLTSGSASGMVINSDVRVQNHVVQQYTDHSQEVCGIRWNTDGTAFASSGNDNMVNVYNEDGGLAHTLTDHMAAVKALAWCPWNHNLLATGAGTNDHHIRFYNTATGNLVNEIDTKSQVTSLLWNQEYKEIISGHGYGQAGTNGEFDNLLSIWKYPTMSKVAELRGHTDRVLGMCMSPDGQTVVSAAGDETLRFWKCFESDTSKKSMRAHPAASRLNGRIR